MGLQSLVEEYCSVKVGKLYLAEAPKFSSLPMTEIAISTASSISSFQFTQTVLRKITTRVTCTNLVIYKNLYA